MPARHADPEAPAPRRRTAGWWVDEHPEIAAELDPSVNQGRNASHLFKASPDPVVWTCRHDHRHRWSQPVGARLRTRHCPWCSLDEHAALEVQRRTTLHPTRNRPGANTDRSGQALVWWQCLTGGPSHDWRDTPYRRIVRGFECPTCEGRPHRDEPPSLASAHPALAAQLDPARNGGLTAAMVPANSTETITWTCPAGPDHIWPAKVSKRAQRGQGCPCCSGHRVSVTNSLATLEPDIAAQFAPELNDGRTAHDVTRSSKATIVWRCDAGPDHIWPATVSNRTGPNRTGCPCCSGLRPSVTNSLASLHPAVAAELATDLDGGPEADETVTGNEDVRMWRCSTDPAHTWATTPAARTRMQSGCPHCILSGRSEVEVRVAFELAGIVGLDVNDHRIEGLGRRRVDVVWRDQKVAVEYDGKYWHVGKEDADADKSARLTELGWTVIRLREAPLEPLGEQDVVVPPGDWRTASTLAAAALARLPYIPEMDRAALAAYATNRAPVAAAAADEAIGELRGAKRPLPGRTRRQIAKVADPESPAWIERFKEFVAEHGHGTVPPDYHCEDGSRLGAWSDALRYGRIHLPAATLDAVEALGFNWGQRTRTRLAWIVRFEAFVAEHGHGVVPATYRSADGAELGSWVRKLRERPDRVTAHDTARLDAAGFIWDLQGRVHAQWAARFEAFVAQHSHGRVPSGHRSPDGARLGVWVGKVRSGRIKLGDAERARLDAAGFIWDLQAHIHAKWLTRFEAFVAEHGHGYVPTEHRSPDGATLGSWTAQVRRGRVQLSAHERAALDRLGFEWTSKTTKTPRR